MAYDDGLIITDAGLQLQLRYFAAGKGLKISRVAYGDGTIAAETDFKKVTALVSPKMDLPIVSSTVTGNGTAEISAFVSNEKVAAPGFPIREIGVFASDGDTEILYSYANFGEHYDWMRSATGTIPINYIVRFEIVIGQTTSLEVTVDTNLAFTTNAEFGDHLTSSNPHPKFLTIGGTVPAATGVFVNNGNMHQLDQMPMDAFRTEVLGDSASTISVLRSRVSQLEIEQDNMMLKMVADDECPDSNLRIAEDFKNPDKVDTFSVQVVNATAGDATIGVASLSGVIPGAWYRITDGVQDEAFQVKSVAKNGSTFRITAAGNLVNTYDLNNCRIWRTTAQIDQSSGTVYGSGDQLGFVTKFDGGVWSGTTASTAIASALDTSQSAADNFTADSGVLFTDDGLISMNQSTIYGIALVQTGGDFGTWATFEGKASEQ